MGDKTLPYYEFPKEENPFLGFRAIRFMLGNEELFKTQLRAILKASAHGKNKCYVSYDFVTRRVFKS